MKSSEVVEILDAYAFTFSYGVVTELAWCDHLTLAWYVRLRKSRADPAGRSSRAQPIDEFLPKVEDLVERAGALPGSVSGRCWSRKGLVDRPSTERPRSRRVH